MLDNKPRSKVILDEFRANLNEGHEVPLSETMVSPPLVVHTQETRVPHRSGRAVTQPEHFIGLKAIQDKDATLWQSTMKTEMESMYSN